MLRRFNLCYVLGNKRGSFVHHEQGVTDMKRMSVVFAAVALSAMATTAWAQTVGMGTGRQGFWTYSTGAAISKVASDAGIRMRVQPHSGTTVYVPSINAGQLEFGLANHLETVFALSGTGLYKGKQQPNLRVVSVIAPLRVTLFVRKNSPIKSLKDLKGKRVPGDYASQRIVQLLTTAFLANAGLSFADVEMVKVPNVVRGANDFAAGKADVFSFALGAGAVSKTAATVGGVRALGVDPSPEAMARLHKFIPVGYTEVLKPAPHLVGIDKPRPIFSYDYLTLAAASTPDEMVYKVTKAMHDGKAKLAAAFKPLREFKPDRMAKNLGKGVIYHPGAIKYYKEIGAWPPKG